MKHLKQLAVVALLVGVPAFGRSVAVQVVEEEALHGSRLQHAELTKGSQSGTAELFYSIQFGNSCVASAAQLKLRTVRDSIEVSEGRYSNHLTILAINTPTERVCPMIYKPVTVYYRSVIRNLSPGETYRALIHGLPTRSEPYTTVEVTAAP